MWGAVVYGNVWFCHVRYGKERRGLVGYGGARIGMVWWGEERYGKAG